MPSALHNLPVKANGTIAPSVFVMMDTSTDFAVLQAVGVVQPPVGISQAGTKYPPNAATVLGGTAGGTQAADAGDELEVFTGGDVCGLLIGSVACNPGDFLTYDGNGRGIPAALGSGKWCGAFALEAGSVGDIIDVKVIPPTKV